MELLQQEKIKSVTLEFPLDSLISQKYTPNEHEGKVKLETTEGEAISIKTKFSARGKFRRKTCDFPPILMNFGNKSLKKNGLKEFDKYKLVTHCKEECFENNVLYREFALYKIYNVITENSFRVHPVQIVYIDTDSGLSTIQNGFIIESNEEIEDRLGLEIVDRFGIAPDSINPHNYETIAVFNYMVGNADFDSKLMHNVKIFKPENEPYFLVPYDFDFAKIVLAPYASHDLARDQLFHRDYHGYKKKSGYFTQSIR